MVQNNTYTSISKIYCVQCGKTNYKASRICPDCTPTVRATMARIKQLKERRYVEDAQLKEFLRKLEFSLNDKFDIKTGKKLDSM